MGKRPTNATKGGKFMNPTDQARKEARRRELKKNKKQRILVRNAVLKGKRPQEIIEELEKIDDMEYNPVTPCPLNQKVMLEKRRKLMDTWDRVFKMYEKEAPDQFEDVKKHWATYQERKADVIRYYESVVAAKDVEIDAIPLPNIATGELGDWEDESDIPLPPAIVQQPKSALKKPVQDTAKTKICPGVPPGPPPSIQDYEDTDQKQSEPSRKRKIRFGGDEEEEEEDEGPPGLLPDPEPAAKAPKPNSLQRKMLEMAGQDLDQFMKEMEEVHKQKEAEKEASLQRRLARLERDQDDFGRRPDMDGRRPDMDGRRPDMDGRRPDMDGRRPDMDGPLRPGVAPPGVGLPQGMPPGQMQQMQQQGMQPGVPPQGVRMPPGPPPGAPPRANRPLIPKPLGVVSAKPQINKSEVKTDSIIESKPVMRNLKSDVTRFVPTNLRVKREDKKGGKKKEDDKPAMFVQQKAAPEQKTTDDAYNEFMKEMSGLL